MDLISIVVPVYQNELNLHDTAPKLISLSSRIPDCSIELVFVDDGSTDRSPQILSELAVKYPCQVTTVSMTRNFGQTPATSAGLQFARGVCAVIISADLQEPWEEIVTMVNHWRGGAKFVLGNRVSRGESAVHRCLSSIYWFIVRRWSMRSFPELGFDFCLLDRQVIEEAKKLSESNTSIFPLLYWLGYKPTLVPIHRSLRVAGRSQWNFVRKVALTLNVLFSFTYVPVVLVGILSGCTMGLAMLCASYLLARCLFLAEFPSQSSILVQLALVIGSFVMISLSVICAYLWRVLDEVRGRPNFVVDEVRYAKLSD